MDTVSKKVRSAIMRTIKSTDTKFESKFRSMLWKKGIRFRKNIKEYPGKPDIMFKKRKVIIFLDSCFWHGCRLHCRLPKSNRSYWLNKIKRNKQRDGEISKYYNVSGWKVLRIWEHELNTNPEKAIKRISINLQY